MATTVDYNEKPPGHMDVEALESDTDSTTQAIKALVEEDQNHDIKLRTMTWQRAAWLLAGDQVCLAIMAQSWSLSYVPDPQTQPTISPYTMSNAP
jgi:hypothetical protein